MNQTPDEHGSLTVPPAIPPTTTAEEQRIGATRRKLSRIWEYTQAIVALLVTVTTVALCILLVLRGEVQASIQLISSAFFLIIGFYFGRVDRIRLKPPDER